MTSRLILFFIAASAGGFGHVDRSSLTGTVHDAFERVLPGTQVLAKNDATATERQTQATGQGFYSLPNLPIGSDPTISRVVVNACAGTIALAPDQSGGCRGAGKRDMGKSRAQRFPGSGPVVNRCGRAASYPSERTAGFGDQRRMLQSFEPGSVWKSTG